MGTQDGIVAIAGDTFEREEDLEDSSLWRDVAGSEDPNKQAFDFFSLVRQPVTLL